MREITVALLREVQKQLNPQKTAFMRYTSADESGDFFRARLLCGFFSAAHPTHHVHSRCSVNEARRRQCILSDGFDHTQRRRVRVHRKAHVSLRRCAP